MKIIPYLILFLISCDCNSNDESDDDNLPACIEKILDNKVLSASLKTIKVQNLNGELHYWLNTDNLQFDGPEYIVNNKCDTVCSFCGKCIPLDCINNYSQNWQIIWRK